MARHLAMAALLAGALAGPAPAQPVVRLPAQDRPLQARPTPVFQVGREDGRAWEVLSDVRQVAFDRAENLYVLDRGNHRVLVFDRAGRFVRQVGKRGSGPGEFTSPSRIAVLGDGTLVVNDGGRRAFSVFGPDGRFVRSVAHDESLGLSGVGMAPHPRGGVLTGAQPLPLPGARNAHAIVWYPLTAGARPSRVLDVPVEAAAPAPRAAGEGARVVSTRRPAFSPTLHWDVLPGGGLAYANGTGWQVRVTGANGAVARVIERPLRPRAVTDRDRQAELARRREAGGSGSRVTVVGGSLSQLPAEVRNVVQEQLARTDFAATMPVIDDVAVDAAGTLWVARTGPVAGDRGPIDLVTADGRYVGTLTGQDLPAAFSRGGRAAYIETDEDGVERVVVRALPARWR